MDPALFVPSPSSPLTNNALQMSGESVPQWAYNIEAHTAAAELPEDDKEYSLKLMGPAVKYGIQANVVFWLLFVLCPPMGIGIMFFVRAYSHEEGLIDVPWWALLPLYAPFLLWSLWLEFQGLKFVMPAAVNFVGNPRICGLELTFAKFFAIAWPVSVVGHVDVVTNALFIANLAATTSSSPAFVNAWKHTQGSLAPVGKLPLPCMPYVLWISVLLQPIYVFAVVKQMGSIKNNRNRLDFPRDYELKHASEIRIQVSVYKTMLEPVQTHMGATMALAGGARQATILFQEITYMQKLHARRNVGTTAYKVMKQEAALGVLRLLLEAALFLTVQTTSLIASKHVMGKPNRNTQVSILLSVLMGFCNFVLLGRRLISYYADVKLGHHAFKCLSLEERKKRLENYPQEQRVTQHALVLLILTIAAMAAIAILFINAAWNALVA